jgi:antitoxin ParD1/3/4
MVIVCSSLKKQEKQDIINELISITWIFYGYHFLRGRLMTMHVNLSIEMEQYIKSKVGSGFYGNATEVIRDAIRRMQAEEERIAAFRTAVAKGDAQIERGEGIAYTSELIDGLTQTAINEMHSSKSMEADVLP